MANKNVKQKNPRSSAILSLVVILVVVALAGYVALFGIGKGTWINYVKPWGEAISLGLDLRGGGFQTLGRDLIGGEIAAADLRKVRARVGDEGAGFAVFQSLNNLGSALCTIVIVVGYHRLFESEARKQKPRISRILGGNEIYLG